MYFEEATDRALLQASTDTQALMSVNGLAVLFLGILPGWLWALCVQVLG
jgi:NADH-quinone oxidoreductase subunit N